jgi:hypothetical protein
MIVILAANVRILARGLAGKIPQRQAKTTENEPICNVFV